MSQDVLSQLLRRADATAEAVFDPDEVAPWPEGALEQIVGLGLLQETAPARSVVCDGCEEGCLENVEFTGGDNGSPRRGYVICGRLEDIGRVEVDLDRLRRWTVDLRTLAHVIGQLLGSKAAVEEVVRSRMWWLGRPSVNRRQVDVFLARGAVWRDAETVFGNMGRLQECSSPLVLVPSGIPARPTFGAAARVLSLGRLLSLHGERLSLDTREVEVAVGKERAERVQGVYPFPTPPGTTWEQVLVEFVNDDIVRIAIGMTADHKNFVDMGFTDRRKPGGQPDQLWAHLRALAGRGGRIEWADSFEVGSHERHKVKKWIGDIRKRLRAYFPTIKGDPFQPYRKVQAYQTRFQLRWSETYERSRQ